MATLGYGRVSTKDQQLTGQLAALKAAGCDHIYREKVSGVRADRPQLVKLMTALKPGDTVVVTKLDRLGRSTRELLDLIECIGAAGASFRSLGDPLFDTSSSQGSLLLAVLAAIASFERHLNSSRQEKRLPGVSCLEPTERPMIDVVRECNSHRLASLATLQDLACLMFGQLRLTAEPCALGHGTNSSFVGLLHEVPCKLGKSAKYGQHRPAVRCGGIGPTTPSDLTPAPRPAISSAT
jgi:predicted site-specific integrase-resolvase